MEPCQPDHRGAALGIVTEQPSDVDGISLPTAKAAELRIGDRLVPVTVERISATQVTFQIREGSLSARPGDVGAIIPRTGRDRGVAGEIPVVFRVPVAANQKSVTVEARCEARHYKAVAAIMLADLDVPRQIRMQRQRRRLYIAELLILLKWVIVGPVSALATALTGRARAPAPTRPAARPAPADRKTQRPQSVPSPAQAA